MSDYRNITIRVARRHLAGLIDLNLAAKAAQHVLGDPVGSIETVLDRSDVSYTSDEKTFEFGYESRAGTWEDPPEYDSEDMDIEITVPDGGTFLTNLMLPARMVAQVPAAQREEFMVDVLRRVVRRMGPDEFLLNVMHGSDGLTDMLVGENGGVSFRDAGLENGRMSTPEPVGRLRVLGGQVILGFKFKASFDCTYSFEVDDPDRFVPKRDYEPDYEPAYDPSYDRY